MLLILHCPERKIASIIATTSTLVDGRGFGAGSGARGERHVVTSAESTRVFINFSLSSCFASFGELTCAYSISRRHRACWSIQHSRNIRPYIITYNMTEPHVPSKTLNLPS